MDVRAANGRLMDLNPDIVDADIRDGHIVHPDSGFTKFLDQSFHCLLLTHILTLLQQYTILVNIGVGNR